MGIRILSLPFLFLLPACGHFFKEKPEAVPCFPETTNPACRFMPVRIDSSFYVQSFTIAPDKQHVYVLASHSLHNPYGTGTQLDLWDTELLQLDTAGRVTGKTMVAKNDRWVAGFWWTADYQLAFLLPTKISLYTPGNLQLQQEWAIYTPENTPTKNQWQTMTGEELGDLYIRRRQQALHRSQSAYVQPNMGHFLILYFKNQPTQAWSIDTRRQDERAYMAKFGQQLPLENLEAPVLNADGRPETDEQMRDGDARLRYLAQGTDDKTRRFTLELSKALQTVRFALSHNESQSLDFAENKYLTTSDGKIWTCYNSQLYRIDLGR